MFIDAELKTDGKPLQDTDVHQLLETSLKFCS